MGYTHLGDLSEQNNENIHEDDLLAFLQGRGWNDNMAGQAISQLKQAAKVGGERSLYKANKAVYELLCYGASAQESAGKNRETVWLIDWKKPENNHFAVAEEVTVRHNKERRPDVVLYVNGIAFVVLELKRSTVSMEKGIRQNLRNQDKAEIAEFFATTQLLLAGNDTQGLHYGVIGTPETHYLQWNEEEEEKSAPKNRLDRHLFLLCGKTRLLEITRDFMVFDRGVKKVCRHHQYMGVKKAQERLNNREGGIIWHTQGSGKSLTMVWLANWLRRNKRRARVVVVTDRIELDEQIVGIFAGVGARAHKATGGQDLTAALQDESHWLVCSLVHKFGAGGRAAKDATKKYARQLKAGAGATGNFYVFVDECHRTQSGVLHKAMKALLPNAVFVGFTGTPLMKKDKQTTFEIFGSYIHTYKYNNAVQDGVALDLCYEARDINQRIPAPEKIDAWFEAKTRRLTKNAKQKLMAKWGQMRQMLSSRGRLERIVTDITHDMETRPRLASGCGNAMLVAANISQACKFYDLFCKNAPDIKCAVVTSFVPTDEDEEAENPLKNKIYRKMLANHFDRDEKEAAGRHAEFESQVKQEFVKEPGQMRLLIVVDKLLTGFDAPPATFLYIDKKMRDHGLFQAICRVNRLYDKDKEYGYIVDYKDLFKSLKKAVADYTGEAFDQYDKKDIEGMMQNRLHAARKKLKETREKTAAFWEDVPSPKKTENCLRHFCGDTKEELAAKAESRNAFYAAVSAYLRAYANIANEMEDAGFDKKETAKIIAETRLYAMAMQEIKRGSGDHIDLKGYEPAMQYLMDNYIGADSSKVLMSFDEMSLTALIAKNADDKKDPLNGLPPNMREAENFEATAITLEHNIRREIEQKRATNPAHYDKMSELLERLVKERRDKAMEYAKYLREFAKIAQGVNRGHSDGEYPPKINNQACRVLFDHFQDEEFVMKVDAAVRENMLDEWRGNQAKMRVVKNAIAEAVGADKADEIFGIVMEHKDDY